MSSHQPVKPPQTPWLAISFGCCASRDLPNDHDGAGLREQATNMQICYNQPRVVDPPRAEPEQHRPTTSHSVTHHVSQWVATGREMASRASARTSSTSHRPWTSHSKAKPSISRPTDFRRFDGTGSTGEESTPVRRRRSFRPLELSIYLPSNRLSPLPDFTESEWSKLPAGLEFPAQALIKDQKLDSRSSTPSSFIIQRKPISGSNRSSLSSMTGRPHSLLISQEDSQREPSPLPSTSLKRSSTHSSLSSPRSNLARLPSPARARSNTEPTHMLSKRGSLRRAKTDVDDAIRELNTIVEERRADALRSSIPSPTLTTNSDTHTHHIPAIAPSLRMHVRSETLSDIGSAFSVPLVSKPLPTPPSSSPAFNQPTSARSKPKPQKKLKLIPPPLPPPPRAGPLTSNPITPPSPSIPTPTTPLGRLGAWLKRSLPSTPTTPSFVKPGSSESNQQSFYQCTPPPPPPPQQQQQQQQQHDSSRSPSPSSPSSRPQTATHARQDSNDTTTITLTSYPSTPALSERTLSPSPGLSSPSSPDTPATSELGKGPLEGVKGFGVAFRERARKRGLSLGLGKEKEKEWRAPPPYEAVESFAGTPRTPVGVAF
ncbi:uncharacterized protein K441DRAFT_673857 [Cenococcum geophilum 1.58]|uniref:uncharacterized protein n=1 Tax=Cenococcum geophilum 1.58 TaxID=794803 RepID=UPI00358FB33C|nr:hypothetical protein K441DRAFT_673857 [Cenococcum geophilum 1.58]